jgi:hypothetical protein
MHPYTLKKREKPKVLEAFTPNTQPYRVIEYLADNARVPVSTLNKITSTGNIADISLKHNETLRQFGLAIGCHRPPAHYLNQFGQPSMMQEWSLCKLLPHEMTLPTKGPDRPKVTDPLFKQRRLVIIDRFDEGDSLNELLAHTRKLGRKSVIRVGGRL